MKMETKERNLEHIEFETKYRVEDHLLIEFKQILEGHPELKDFLYVEGPDHFYVYPQSWFDANPQWDPNGTFVRYRKPSFGLDKGRRQVTWKYKPKDAKNNIQRKENNWDIGKTPENVIIEQLLSSGLTFNASIIKNCHIYFFDDATLVFYTVYDTTFGKPKKADYFVEIEVSEDNIAEMTEDQAWAVIEKFEKILAPLGISPQKRLRKSLFEMYKKEVKNVQESTSNQ